ncbi:Leu/Phe/Val dehydrogenase [Catalinimonas niigatensis]|uniref:Leu/Phe/Val dehydrogenase n=1 Tax=Catalinimonas niigatensis TaxID=1397264 RepID=UPI002AA2B58F|nr:Glu/Leu/Phe/Val dehydrogenase dimerization domain-containing protein [Catalinimonas niigatensis]WPP53385.1 Glu/Leu/Phe/Val dehydrogenase dimerization domain-containing protein [Catalinimonas niigatensis]
MEVKTAESLPEASTGRSVNAFEVMAKYGHEQLVQCYDESTGLKAVIGIHSTVLGPAMGGTRMWNYVSDEEGVIDALRLSRGMTYKAAISGLNIGGGKAVLIGDAKKIKSEAYLRRFGKFIESLNGKYVTAGDVNITTHDLEYIRMETSHVTGLPETLGGGGSSSLITAFGVYMGIKAAAKQAFGSDHLEHKKVAVQGVGAVGMKLVEYLSKENAEVFVSDVEEDRLQIASRAYGAHVVSTEHILAIEADIYAPCALGATLNDLTIPQLKCRVIAGGANNQLAQEDRHGQMLMDRGIVYAPDFLVNAGGIMAVAAEYFGDFNKNHLYQKAERIYDNCMQVLKEASGKKKNTQLVAIEMAEKRIVAISQLHRTL